MDKFDDPLPYYLLDECKEAPKVVYTYRVLRFK